MSRSGRRSPFGFVFLLVLLAAAAIGIRGAIFVGDPPAIELAADREAIGPGTRVSARFTAPESGLVTVRLEAVQGANTATLAEQSFSAISPWWPFAKPESTEATLEATVGRGAPEWLAEGEVTLRAVATRPSGPLRDPDPALVEKALPVRFRPPSLGVQSVQHYLTQGGSGAVRFTAGPGTARAGVRAGREEFPAFAYPGGGAGDMFALFGLPWDLADSGQIRVFVEDAAGNRAERSFVDQFKPIPPRRDSIELSDRFFERVVPDIVANSPGFDTSGSMLDQYLRINGAMRRANIAKIRELAARTKPARLWSGAFLQMPNSQKMAGFAEVRSYLYQGRKVDEQTHLGLDLASIERAPVPAAAAGEVAFAAFLGIYGKLVILDHGYGLMTIYAHLSSFDVQEGERVERGQSVGRSGATGLAGGDHLHFGVAIHGLEVSPIEWLDGKWILEKIDARIPPANG